MLEEFASLNFFWQPFNHQQHLFGCFYRLYNRRLGTLPRITSVSALLGHATVCIIDKKLYHLTLEYIFQKAIGMFACFF